MDRFIPHGFLDSSGFTEDLAAISYTSSNRGPLNTGSGIIRDIIDLSVKLNNSRSPGQFSEIISGSRLKFVNLEELFVQIGSKINVDASIL